MENQEAESRYIIGTVDSALSILNLFFEYEELSAAEVGKLLGVSRSTAFRFMVTLENRGFVTKTASGKYRLGLNMFSLGMLAYNFNRTTLRLRNGIAPEDHIPSLCWVGDTSRGFVLISLDNALGMKGAAFTFADKGEGTLPFEFQAHQDSAADQAFAPCRIVFFD